MGPIRQEIEIDVARGLVFDFVADLANRPAFVEPYQSHYHLERIDSDGVGAAARFKTKPGSSWAGTEIEKLEPPHRIVERGCTGRLNRVPMTTVWEFVELPGGLTRVTVIHFTTPERLFDRFHEHLGMATRAHSRGWAESLRRLRDALESGEVTPRVRVAGGNRHRTGIV